MKKISSIIKLVNTSFNVGLIAGMVVSNKKFICEVFNRLKRY